MTDGILLNECGEGERKRDKMACVYMRKGYEGVTLPGDAVRMFSR